MPVCSKFIASFVLVLVVSLFSSTEVSAQVVINEFSSDTAGTTADPDWIELYNNSDAAVDLSQFRMEDYGVTNTKALSDAIGAKGFAVVEWSNKLNKTGDEISLIKISDGSLVDKVGYGDKGTNASAPGPGQSAGRQNDGDSNWLIFNSPTKGQSNGGGQSTPTIPPSPTPTMEPTSATPTSTSSPSPTAVYKINEAKDGSGNILTSVKVYVDGAYIHHYAPETLTFCDGCKCDTEVSCGFGSHTMTLGKSGYQNWNETKTFNLGDFYEVNPVMNLASQTPSPTPTRSPTDSSLKSTAPSAGGTATPKALLNQPTAFKKLPGEILGEEKETTVSGEATSSAEILTVFQLTPTGSLKDGVNGQENKPQLFLILGGISLLAGGTILAWRKKERLFSSFGSP